jgi:hypothetical protein
MKEDIIATGFVQTNYATMERKHIYIQLYHLVSVCFMQSLQQIVDFYIFLLYLLLFL